MKLDETHIAIRERGLLDILDLSLRVVVAFGGPLLLCFATVVLPLMLLNWWLIGWMPAMGDEEESLFRYLRTMTVLVAIQAPLVSIFSTPLIGNAMFVREVGPRVVWQAVARGAGALFLVQGVLRGILFSWILVALIPTNEPDFTAWEGWLIVLLFYSGLFRAVRPFSNEIILLERNPLVARTPDVISIRRRSSALHGPNTSDLLGRSIGVTFFAAVLVLCLLFTFWFFQGMLLFNWNWGPFMLQVVFPLTLWMVAAYCSVVRFLSYLDVRIRREGWEVELVIRAAAAALPQGSPS